MMVMHDIPLEIDGLLWLRHDNVRIVLDRRMSVVTKVGALMAFITIRGNT